MRESQEGRLPGNFAPQPEAANKGVAALERSESVANRKATLSLRSNAATRAEKASRKRTRRAREHRPVAGGWETAAPQ
jgi:hypothetical protein